MPKPHQHISDLMDFLQLCPTAWHAVDWLKERFCSLGYIEIDESQRWQLEAGSSYVVERNGSSLLAFTLPSGKPSKACILGSHTDSPALRLKPSPSVYENKMGLLSSEVYGGPLINSWLNRELGLAGRVSYIDRDGKVCERLVNCSEYPLLIPQLAIHLDRELSTKGLLLDKQKHLRALVGLGDELEDSLSFLLKQEVEYEELLS